MIALLKRRMLQLRNMNSYYSLAPLSVPSYPVPTLGMTNVANNRINPMKTTLTPLLPDITFAAVNPMLLSSVSSCFLNWMPRWVSLAEPDLREAEEAVQTGCLRRFLRLRRKSSTHSRTAESHWPGQGRQADEVLRQSKMDDYDDDCDCDYEHASQSLLRRDFPWSAGCRPQGLRRGCRSLRAAKTAIRRKLNILDPRLGCRRWWPSKLGILLRLRRLSSKATITKRHNS